MSLSAKSASLFKRDVVLFMANLATGIVIARTLGPTPLGLWVILQMILGYAEAFGRMKWDIASVYFLGKRKYEVADVVFTLNAMAVITSLVLIGLMLWRFEWLYHVLFAQSEVNVRPFVYLVLLQIPLQFLSLNYIYLSIFREDVRTYNIMVIIRSLVSSVLGIAMVLVFKMGLLGVVIASVLSVLSALVYGAVKCGRPGRVQRYINLPLIKDLSAYGAILYVSGIIAQLNAYAARSIVVYFLPPAQVAYFAMAQNQGQLLNKVPDALNVLLFPRIAKTESDDESALLTARAFRVVFVILFPVALVGYWAISPLTQLLYGRAFLAMVTPFRIILPGLVLSGAATVIDQYFQGIGRPDLSAKIAIAPFAIQVLAAVMLIPPLGLTGAALAFLAALLSLALIQVAVFLRISTCTIKRDLLMGSQDLRVVTAFVRSQLAAVL